MTAYQLRLRPQGRITVHAARRATEGAHTACGVQLDLVGPDAVHAEPDLDPTCRTCRDQLHGKT